MPKVWSADETGPQRGRARTAHVPLRIGRMLGDSRRHVSVTAPPGSQPGGLPIFSHYVRYRTDLFLAKAKLLAMPITPFLNGEHFDPETKRVMGVASP
jgi:hypothetical protein